MYRSARLFCLLFAAALALASGCSQQNDAAAPLDITGAHPSGWIAAHRISFQKDAGLCRDCHGADLTGGIARVDCFNQGNLPSCHLGGHGPRKAPHAVPFLDPALHGTAAKENLVVCQVCHALPGGAGTNPRFNVNIGSLATGCEAAGCHRLENPAFPARSSAHPIPWRGHPSSGNQVNACALCHGASFGGGAGPACSNCHTALGQGALPIPGSCVSCHAQRPATGSHAAHLALPGFVCANCHTGGGFGATGHGKGTVILSVPAAFNAKSGPAVANGNGSCSAVSCHGGITTPAWGGSINIATGCTSCHTDGTATPGNPPQFNSFRSGRHAFHFGQAGLSCTDCHDMTVSQAGASHFGALDTPAFELPPLTTIRGYLNYDAAGPSCMPAGIAPPGNTVGACHTDRRLW